MQTKIFDYQSVRDYTANVCSNLQAVYRDFGVQGFQNYRGYM